MSKFKIGDIVRLKETFSGRPAVGTQGTVAKRPEGRIGLFPTYVDFEGWWSEDMQAVGVDDSMLELISPNEDTETEAEHLLKQGYKRAETTVVSGASGALEKVEGGTYISPTGARRYSGGKVKYSLVPLDLLDGTARVLEKGAANHGRNNYRKGFPPIEVLDSLMRHLEKLQRAIEEEDKDGSKGYLLDDETKEGHVHHLLCNTLFAVDSLRKAGYKV